MGRHRLRVRRYCSTRGCELQWRDTTDHECSNCGAVTHENKPISKALASARIYAQPDIPEHFNFSLDCVVKGRRHLRQIQRERNVQDYEPQRYAQRGFVNGPDGVRTRVNGGS